MTPSDEELMARFGAGDPAAFDALLERYQRPLVNHILRIVEDRATAEDVFQETFVRLWEQARRFDPRKASFATFLYTIATNLCRSELRRRHRQRPRLRRGDGQVAGAPRARAAAGAAGGLCPTE